MLAFDSCCCPPQAKLVQRRPTARSTRTSCLKPLETRPSAPSTPTELITGTHDSTVDFQAISFPPASSPVHQSPILLSQSLVVEEAVSPARAERMKMENIHETIQASTEIVRNR